MELNKNEILIEKVREIMYTHPVRDMRRWWSGLSQQTVNLSPSGFVGSNPTRRTI